MKRELTESDFVSRQQAIEWWKNLAADTKSVYMDKYHPGRSEVTLTGRELQEMYYWNIGGPELIKFNELEQGDEFRFPYENESTVRYVSQIGKIEMYCPRKGDNTMGHSKAGGEDVYLKSDRPVILISRAKL